MDYSITKPTVWAYNITTNHALFEGNIKKPRPTAGIATQLTKTDQDICTAKEIHDMLLATKDNVLSSDNISHSLLNKFSTITKIASGYSEEAGYCTAFLIGKNDKLYSVILLGIKIAHDINVVSSKIIKDHLI